MPAKPALLLVANAILPNSASEPGKGYAWALALGRVYSLHIVTEPGCATAVAAAGGELATATLHPAGVATDHSTRLRAYGGYARWCRDALGVCQRVLREHPGIIGLHHATIASFRVLPRYDRLGVPYTLGPLGGGEGAPLGLLARAGLPWRALLTEAARLPANAAVRLLPARRVLTGARLVLGTTPETAALLAGVGARETAVAYPDALDALGAEDELLALRGRQAAGPSLQDEFRCLLTGRAVWWKGPHLAIRLIRRLRDRGVNAVLTLHCEGPALPGLKELAARLDLGDHVRFPGFASREGLREAYREHHAYVLPSLHESSSSAILEGYAAGLPSITLGLGGTATVAGPGTGLNGGVGRLENWFEDAGAMVQGWVADPARWLAACRAARARAGQLTSAHLEAKVREFLGPERYR